MKICFYSWNNLIDVFSEMGRFLEFQSVEIVHAIYSDREEAKLRNVYNGQPYNLLSFMKRSKAEKKIDDYILKYELPPLMQLVYADRHIREYRDMTIIENLVLQHIRFWEDFFENEKPNYLVSEAISGLSVYLAYLIGKKYGCTYLGVTHSRLPDKFYITEDEFGYNKKLNSLYLVGNEQSKSMLAEEFIQNFKKNKTKPSYMIVQAQPPKIGSIRQIGTYINDGNSLDYFYTNGNINLATAVMRKISRKVRYYILSRFNKQIFEFPREEDFVLFPVHFQPEASTMVQAPFFENQVAIIENIARTLPIGVMLYVKDHYAAIGSKELEFYRQIKRLPNVRLINPYVDSHSLIKKSKIVITITGTVGWEAILYDKPVIVFGDVFYDVYSKVVKVTDYTKLSDAIKQILDGEQRYVNEEDRNAFVGSYLNSLYSGEFDVERLEISSVDSNIQKLCSGLLSYIEERERLIF